MSDMGNENMNENVSSRWFMQSWVKLSVGFLVALMIVAFVVLWTADSAAKDDSKEVTVSYTEINNDEIKPLILNVIDSSIVSLNEVGGEMNYFVNGYNVELSVYNPSADVGEKAASYVGNPDGRGGSYVMLSDDQNFVNGLKDKLVPRKDDTFAVWSWDGDENMQAGYFLADVGVGCESPDIGEKPSFKMCESVVPNGVTVLVEDGKVSQVFDVTDEANKTIRTLSYGVTQAVNGVLEQVYKVQ